MKIAVNTRHLLDNRLEGVGIVTDEVLRRMVQSHPDDSFIYYFDRPYHERFIHGPNVNGENLWPVTRLPVLIRYWLNNRVRPHVVKERANVFFSPDGFIPLGMSTPKVSMVHDVAFLRYPEYLQPRIRKFYETWMPRYLAYTDHIITVSEFSKQDLISGYKLPADKISVVYNGITDSYKPVDALTKQQAQQKYAGGKPYLVYLGAIHPRKNVTVLVKAFEKFKANVRSDVQLVIAGRASWHTEDVFKAIENSPFKNEIHLPGYVPTDEAVALVGSAEAMVYPSRYEGFGLPLVEAMACGVPVICSDVSSLPEVAGGAALLFSPDDVDALAANLDKVVFDTDQRKEMIAAGNIRVLDFSWERSAEQVYSVLRRFAR
jgi:glycosyltransferase involved in cell wall biosynthesis